MIFAVFKLLLMSFLLSLPVLVAAVRFGKARAWQVLWVSLALSGCAGLATPAWDSFYIKLVLGLLLLVWAAWIRFAPVRWVDSIDVFSSHPGGRIFIVLSLITVVPLGNLEWAARMVTGIGLISYHDPMETLWLGGVEDWRVYHMSANAKREHDPELFWRSRPGIPPFNAQGFKAEFDTDIPKSPDVFRIIAYGDSNTEGPVRTDWARKLQDMLNASGTPGVSYEVLNAGVAAYSSYQGVQRFAQEAEIYEPDLVLVSFGWDDLPDALDQPDKSYQPISALQVKILQLMSYYRTYLVLQHHLNSPGLADRLAGVGPRVPLSDYVENMQRFARIGQDNGIEVVFFTHPYRIPTERILTEVGWRKKAPEYNRALVDFAKAEGANWIDVQKHFERDVSEDLFGDEIHFNEAGRQEMARYLRGELEARGLLPGK